MKKIYVRNNYALANGGKFSNAGICVDIIQGFLKATHQLNDWSLQGGTPPAVNFPTVSVRSSLDYCT